MIAMVTRKVVPGETSRTRYACAFAVDATGCRPFVFEEPIGGGHAERDGASAQ